jgi:hypothetical protein
VGLTEISQAKPCKLHWLPGLSIYSKEDLPTPVTLCLPLKHGIFTLQFAIFFSYNNSGTLAARPVAQVWERIIRITFTELSQWD